MSEQEVLVEWLTANNSTKQLMVVGSGLLNDQLSNAAGTLVLRITLNRPRRGNAINKRMAEQLLEVYALVRKMATTQPTRIRWLLLTGAGKYFCSGTILFMYE